MVMVLQEVPRPCPRSPVESAGVRGQRFPAPRPPPPRNPCSVSWFLGLQPGLQKPLEAGSDRFPWILCLGNRSLLRLKGAVNSRSGPVPTIRSPPPPPARPPQVVWWYLKNKLRSFSHCLLATKKKKNKKLFSGCLWTPVPPGCQPQDRLLQHEAQREQKPWNRLQLWGSERGIY